LIRFRRDSHHLALRRYPLQSLSLQICRPQTVRRLATCCVQMLHRILQRLDLRSFPPPSRNARQ
jgi:hypothetical protein